NGYGAVNKSMAGAGVATGFDAMSQATNPAALTLVNPQFTADLSVFSPRREATLAGAGVVPGTYESDRNYFFVPSLAGAYEIDGTSMWGWAIYGNGGMNTTYDDPLGPFGGGKTGVDLAQLFIQGTYAREVTPGFSIGIGPVIAAQRFKAFGLAPFGVANNDYDYSYGFGGRIGFQADLVSGLRFGASYQTKMFMSEFDDYADLFAEQGDFDIPSALQAGISWEPTSGLTLAADWKRIWYSDVASVSNTFFAASPLGADDGPGFGWDDVDTFKLGVAWEANSTITMRFGASLNNNPIPDEEVLFNVLAPGVQEQHYTAGLGWKLDASNTINLGAMYSPSNSVTGPNPNGGGDITIEMYQWEATVGWTMTF
ncbi:MAG: outer membrane protein transport protein, partial [Alphaproteobacteria bacterium]|nr:outer membrane protein transport protein [Alphaproteobacteria bacterium]